jgi:hypothetical protein
MHPELLAKAVSAIFAETNVDDFQIRTGIVSRRVAKSVLEFLINNGIGEVSPYGMIHFSDADRLKTAILALQMGCEIEDISKKLSWKDFEALTSELFKLGGYKSEVHIWFSKPRMEIDVVGIDSKKFAIVVDCKHWKYGSLSVLCSYARKQTERTKVFLAKRSSITSAVPIIVTLHCMKVRFINGFPIVPIREFKSFLEKVNDNLSQIKVLYGK